MALCLPPPLVSDHERWQTVIARNTLTDAKLRLAALDYLAESREPGHRMEPGAWWDLSAIE